MILYETLFDALPMDASRSKIQEIVNSCQMERFSDLVLGLPERSCDFGPRRLIGLLLTLSLQCMNKAPAERPKLDWVQVVLKESIAYLEALY